MGMDMILLQTRPVDGHGDRVRMIFPDELADDVRDNLFCQGQFPRYHWFGQDGSRNLCGEYEYYFHPTGKIVVGVCAGCGAEFVRQRKPLCRGGLVPENPIFNLRRVL